MKRYYFYYTEENELINFNREFNFFLKRLASMKGVGVTRKVVTIKRLIEALETRNTERYKEIIKLKCLT